MNKKYIYEYMYEQYQDRRQNEIKRTKIDKFVYLSNRQHTMLIYFICSCHFKQSALQCQFDVKFRLDTIYDW